MECFAEGEKTDEREGEELSGRVEYAGRIFRVD